MRLLPAALVGVALSFVAPREASAAEGASAPPAPVEAPRPKKVRRTSTSMMVGGIALTSFGVLAIPAGALVYVYLAPYSTNGCEYSVACAPSNPGTIAGGTLMGLGGLGLLLGIPFLVTGAQPARPAWASTKVIVGPGSLSLIGQF